MTHIHKTSYCVLYIFIFISCSRGEAMNVDSTSLIEITTTDSCSADQDMELKPRAVPAGRIQMVPLNQLRVRANMNQLRVGPSLNQFRARPNMNQLTVGMMQIQRTVVRQRGQYFRPDINKYPKGAVYARYRVPPIYVTFKCPPKIGLLLCRGSCERRSKYTIGSCDNGYCTCLLLTPGFRGKGTKKKGVFARKANCSLREDRMKCNRFCRYQFGRTAYGLCRGTVCRCFTNPGISTKNQMSACEQARKRLAFLEASLRKILRNEPSTRTPAERRFLQEVRKRPEVLKRISSRSGRRSPRRVPYSRGTGSPGSPGYRKPQPTLQQTIPLSKIPNKYTGSPRKSPARATKFVPGPSKSPYQSPRRAVLPNQRTGKSNSSKGGSNSKKGGSNSRRVGSSPRKGGSSSRQAPKRAESPLKDRRQSPGNGGFDGVPTRKKRKEEDDDDDESGENGSLRNGGNGGGRNGGVGGRVGGGGGQGGGYGRGRGEDGENGDEFGRGGGGGRGGGVGGGQGSLGGGVGGGLGGLGGGDSRRGGSRGGRGGLGGGRDGPDGGGGSQRGGKGGLGGGRDSLDGGGGSQRGGRGGLGGGGDGSQRGGRGGVDGGGGFLGGGRGGLGGGEESRSGGRNGLTGGGGGRGGDNRGYDTPGKNGYAPGGQKYGQGYGGRGHRLNSEEDDSEEDDRRGLNAGYGGRQKDGHLAGDVPNYGRTDSRRDGRGSVTPSVTPSGIPASTPRSGKQVPPRLAQQTLGRDDPTVHVGGKFGDPAERSRDAPEQERTIIDPKTGNAVVVPPPPSQQGGQQDLPIPPGAQREGVKVDPVTGQTYLPNHPESKPILPEEGACPIPPAPGVQDRLRDPQDLREQELRNQGGLRDDLRDNRNLGYQDDPPRNREQEYRDDRRNQGRFEDDYAGPGRRNRNNQGGYYNGDEDVLDQWVDKEEYNPDEYEDGYYEQQNRNPRGVRSPSYEDEIPPRYQDRLGPQYQREDEYPPYQQQQGYGNRQQELEEEEAYRREQELMQRPRPRY